MAFFGSVSPGGWARASAAGALAFLAACAGAAPPPAPPPPAFDFAAGEPIALFVEAVEVEDAYLPPLAEPNVEHEFAAGPDDFVRAWAAQRIRPAGEGAPLTVTILDASVVEETVEQERPGELFGGLRRQIKDAPNRRLLGRVQVKAAYDGPYGSFTVDVETTGFVDVNKRASLNIIEEQYNGMLETMAVQFDEAMTRRIEQSMADLVLRL